LPEFTSDVIGKKGEKVDYAIKLDNEIVILVECKSLSTKLEPKHLSQLYRYFTVTNARFCILTNGIFYEFYSDIEEKNKLDARPFFIFNILDASASGISELKKFERSTFDIGKILATAERLKYVSAVKKYILEQMENPSDELIKITTGKVHERRSSAQVKELVSNSIKTAFKEIVREAVQSRLSSALESSNDTSKDEIELPPEIEIPSDGIVTTQEEVEGTMTIKAIVRDILDVKRVALRDSLSYCAVILDNNNRKPLVRMHFNRKQWYIGLFDQGKEERVMINDLNDIYQLADRIRVTAERYRDV
jgi:hypothetical protein